MPVLPRDKCQLYDYNTPTPARSISINLTSPCQRRGPTYRTRLSLKSEFHGTIVLPFP